MISSNLYSSFFSFKTLKSLKNLKNLIILISLSNYGAFETLWLLVLEDVVVY